MIVSVTTIAPFFFIFSVSIAFLLLDNSDRLFMIASMASQLAAAIRPTEDRLERDILGTDTSEVIDYSKNLAQNFPVTESLSSVKEPHI